MRVAAPPTSPAGATGEVQRGGDGDDTRTLDPEGRLIEILCQVGQTLGSGLDVDEVLARLAALAAGATRAERCGLFLVDEDGKHLIPATCAVRAGDVSASTRLFKESGAIDISAGAPWDAPDGGMVAIEDAQASARMPASWKVWGARSVAWTPVQARGSTFGLLTVDHITRQHRFSADELRLLGAIASAMGVAVYTARIVSREARARDLQRRILECSAALRAGESLARVLHLVVAGFEALLTTTRCAIYLMDERRVSLRAVASGDGAVPVDVLLADLPQRDVEQIRRAWNRDPQRPINVSNVRNMADWRHLVPADLDAGVLIPLAEAGDVFGFVVFGRRGAPFSESELAVARALGDQAAAAVSFARVNEQEQARIRLLETLYGLSDVVVGAINVRSLLARLNDWVQSRVGIECLQASFLDPALQGQLRANPLTPDDEAVIRAWRGSHARRAQAGDIAPQRRGEKVGLPIVVDRTIEGILWVRAPNYMREDELSLVRVLASGIGELAHKDNLRRTVERRSQELAVSAERERIARDLHDTVGQAFYAISLGLQDLRNDATDPALAERIGEIRALAAGGVADVRSAVYALSFLHVRAKGLGASLRMLARQFTRTTGVSVQVRIAKGLRKPSEETESALYRTAHEALVNIDRHARATGVVLTLAQLDDVIDLEIRDDGVGLDQRQARDWRSAAHFGMRTMAKCIREVGGEINFTEAHPRGLVITATVPTRDPAER